MPITREELNKKLWSAADILRGSIDSGDYKNYIFGFLFLKRLSDRFEEEAETIFQREKKGGASDAAATDIAYNDPDEHAFFVPERARWGDIKKVSSDIGEALNKACAALEEANGTKFEGVLLGIDFNDNRKLGGDKKAIDAILSKLVQHFSTIPLRNMDLAEPDMLGRAYEYLIEKFADDSGKKGGEFYTPRGVVKLIVELLDPKEGMRICDPTCGSGGMLIECAHHIQTLGGNPRNISLYGQEKNFGTWGICKMNMLMHGLIDARIEKGDTIRDPKLLEGGELMRFDRVIANPPFSLDQWGHEEAEKDRFGRFRRGVPPKTKGDLAFVQHMLETTLGTGMVGVVMPHGVLFRGGKEGEIRQQLVEEDLLEAVIGLAPNLFYGTGIPAAILVFNRNKPKERRGKVLFIHAASEFEAGKNQNFLRDGHIARILEAFKAFADADKFAHVIDAVTIKANDYNLNISRYVDVADEAVQLDVAEELAKLRAAEQARNAAEARMNQLLAELGFKG